VRPETKQKESAARGEELNARLLEAQDGSDHMRTNLDDLHKVSEELKNLAYILCSVRTSRQKQESFAKAEPRL